MQVHSSNKMWRSLISAVGAVALVACSSLSSGSSTQEGSDEGLSGNELWARRCSTCHNLRSPSIYTDSQWTAAVGHMRTRAKLNGKETAKILHFLQKSN